MSRPVFSRLGALLTCAGLLCVPAIASAQRAGAEAPRDFALGMNAEQQACRAQSRFDGRSDARTIEVYCGDWERPSGVLTVRPAAKRADAAAALKADCDGPIKPLSSSAFTLSQVNCGVAQEAGTRRFGLVAERGGEVAMGTAYPADWAPLARAAGVLLGVERANALQTRGETAGLAEIRAVYPAGPPGQGAAFNYTLLRRRAYEQNIVWSFTASERDFSELLRAHKQIAPEDLAGDAEILAEIGLNQSDAGRFEDANDVLQQAEREAEAAKDGLLASKILNYRAIDATNQRHYADALKLSKQAADRRTSLAKQASETAGGFRISPQQAGEAQKRARATARALLIGGGDQADAAERMAILSAQGFYLQSAAARALRDRSAPALLDEATRRLTQARYPPAWLTAQIAAEGARQRLAAGDARGAQVAAERGLVVVRASSPGTRAEGHLMMTLADAQAQAGNMTGALATGRAAIALFARQRETPGLSPDVAAGHLERLLATWSKTPDAATANEVFETMALVWDGAAARSAAQLAARLALREASKEARGYQDAERAYRAALARRQRVAATPDMPASTVASVDDQATAAASALATAEAALRAKSPRYLELLSPRLKAADLIGVMQPDEGYLRFVLSEREGFGVLVTREGSQPFAVGLSRPQAEALSARLGKSVQYKGRLLPDYDLKDAQALYAGLIGPVAESVAKLKRLQIDAPGALASVPFAALVETPPSEAVLAKITDGQDYTGVAWLARRVAVASSVGPASFISLRKSQGSSEPLRVATFGGFRPSPDAVAARLASVHALSPRCTAEVASALRKLPALPSTGPEAQAVAGLFGASGHASVGPAFTDASFLKSPDVARDQVLLLATHGVLGLSSCFSEPALLASLGDGGDGLIEASELLDLKLTARLVMLSACDTAGGARSDTTRTGLTDGGEALSGLARAFLYAGAKSVLATQWKVDAQTSSEQSTSLLKAAIAGRSIGEALQGAQAAAFDTPETAHPFYWAAFTLIGDGAAVLQPKGGMSTKVAAAR